MKKTSKAKPTKLESKPTKKILKAPSKSVERRQAIQKAEKPKKEKETTEFLIRLEVNGKEFVSKGNDLQRAILGLKPDQIKTRAFFTLEHDGKTAKVMSIIPRTKRIINSEMTAYFFGRRLMSILKSKEEMKPVVK